MPRKPAFQDDRVADDSSLATELSAFTPKSGTQAKELPIQDLDRLARQHGFLDRSPPVEPKRRRGRRKTLGEVKFFNIRAPINVFDRFVALCDNEQATYWEMLEQLMNKAGVDQNGNFND
ncbi:hypothetical protein BTE77_34660 [Ensifer adhaerens]|nr:hypothetical protein BTE77_34660 [Ensifer adhaerens]